MPSPDKYKPLIPFDLMVFGADFTHQNRIIAVLLHHIGPFGQIFWRPWVDDHCGLNFMICLVNIRKELSAARMIRGFRVNGGQILL